VTRTRSLLVLSLLLTLGACATEQPFVWVATLSDAKANAAPTIRPRDSIVVVVRDQPSLSGEFAVREDGGILLPTVGEIRAGGRTPEELASELHARLSSMVVNPAVTVSISRTAPIRVNVIGEVKTPSSYELTRDRSVTAALAAAGWLTEFANRDRIFVIRHDGEPRVRFHERDITAPGPAAARFRLNDGDVVVVE
jgi:polysaccharide export outer membrane protein